MRPLSLDLCFLDHNLSARFEQQDDSYPHAIIDRHGDRKLARLVVGFFGGVGHDRGIVAEAGSF